MRFGIGAGDRLDGVLLTVVEQYERSPGDDCFGNDTWSGLSDHDVTQLHIHGNVSSVVLEVQAQGGIPQLEIVQTFKKGFVPTAKDNNVHSFAEKRNRQTTCTRRGRHATEENQRCY